MTVERDMMNGWTGDLNLMREDKKIICCMLNGLMVLLRAEGLVIYHQKMPSQVKPSRQTFHCFVNYQCSANDNADSEAI